MQTFAIYSEDSPIHLNQSWFPEYHARLTCLASTRASAQTLSKEMLTSPDGQSKNSSGGTSRIAAAHLGLVRRRRVNNRAGRSGHRYTRLRGLPQANQYESPTSPASCRRRSTAIEGCRSATTSP